MANDDWLSIKFISYWLVFVINESSIVSDCLSMEVQQPVDQFDSWFVSGNSIVNCWFAMKIKIVNDWFLLSMKVQ